MDKNKYIWIEYLCFICAVLVFGLIIKNTYYLQIMTFIGINTLLALGLNMLMGYTGQVSLGHAAFYGIGAYTTAILSGTYAVNPWICLVCAVGRCRRHCLHCGASHLAAFGLLPCHGHPWVRHDCQYCHPGVGRCDGRGIRFCGHTRA